MSETTRNKQTMFEMFADATTGESYADNRLITRETDGGNVALIAYGWLKIAEYNESRETITVFHGHKSLGSKVITRWLNDVERVVGERRDIILSGESPTVATPNDTTHYIGSYIGDGPLSPVESKALKAVVDSLRFLNE